MNLSRQLTSLKFLSLAAILSVSFTAAHATPIVYSLDGLTTANGSITGTVDINSATDVITSADLTFDYNGVGIFTFTDVTSAAAYNGLGQAWITGTDPTPGSSAQIALYYDTANFAGGTGDLMVCLESGPGCGTAGIENSTLSIYWPDGFNADITAGTLDAPDSPAPTPEPSSLLLLGTGILGLAGFARHRMLKA